MDWIKTSYSLVIIGMGNRKISPNDFRFEKKVIFSSNFRLEFNYLWKNKEM